MRLLKQKHTLVSYKSLVECPILWIFERGVKPISVHAVRLFLDLPVDSRDYRQCAEVLFDLGLCKVKVISNNPGKLKALQDAGLEIVERVSIEVESSAPAAKYLRTKKEKMGHLLELKAS